MIRNIVSDKRGAAAVEMAFALPVTIMLMIGILQFALVLQASGAMRHGLGEGLRYAKVNTVSDPSDSSAVAAHKATVEEIAKNSLAGVNPSGIKAVTFARGVSNGAQFGSISMEYELKPIIPFAAIPAIKLNESRQIYLPS